MEQIEHGEEDLLSIVQKRQGEIASDYFLAAVEVLQNRKSGPLAKAFIDPEKAKMTYESIEEDAFIYGGSANLSIPVFQKKKDFWGKEQDKIVGVLRIKQKDGVSPFGLLVSWESSISYSEKRFWGEKKIAEKVFDFIPQRSQDIKAALSTVMGLTQ